MKSGLILGDSLSFARPKHNISIQDTWPYLLNVELGDYIVFRSKGGGDSISMLNEARHLKSYYSPVDEKYMFDWSVVQVGIVDCCPRKTPRQFEFVLTRFVPGGSRIIRFYNRLDIARNYMKPWVSLENYKKNMLILLGELKVLCKNVYFVEIAPPKHYLVENCGDFCELVSNYNNVLFELLPNGIARPFSDSIHSSDFLLPDGHHLTKQGHIAVADSLIELILNNVSNTKSNELIK